MNVDSFLDTNVLIYAALGGAKAPTKRGVARELIRTANFGTSTQVLQEFYVNVVRKSDKPMSVPEAMEWVDMLSNRPCTTVDSGLVKSAIEYSNRYQVSYWDAAILVAAEYLGAGTVYTEDLNHNQLYGAVRVVNPFLSS